MASDEFMMKALEYIKACFDEEERQLNIIIEQNDAMMQAAKAQVTLLERILDALDGR